MTTQTIPIGGMTCAACVGRVEKAIRAVAGVERAVVNLATEKASVSYDAEAVRLSAIKAAVEKAGYAVPDSAGADADALRKAKAVRTLWTKFAVAAAFSLPLLYIAMAPMITAFRLPFPAALRPMSFPFVYALTELLLALPVIAVGYRFYVVGYKALLARSPNMDSLIAVGTTAAVLYSLYNTAQIALGSFGAVDSLYFESAAVIITLILLGKSLEAVSKGRTGEAIKKLMGLQPKTALVVGKDGAEREIPIDEVVPGDVISVKPGAKIPVDGTVLEGRTAIDESMLTGESMPVGKKAGDAVYAATLNATGAFRFRADKVGADTALAQIIRLVEDAQGSKAPIAKLADVVAGVFVPVVCAVALLAGAAWYVASLHNPALLPAGYLPLRFALTVFISVLVIACPCALGLATPTAIMVGTGKGAENGILIKGGEALETAHKITTVVFDKTGTLTEGKPRVTDIVLAADAEALTEDGLLARAAGAEKGSEHPLGQALVREAETRGLALPAPSDFASLTGRGIEARFADGDMLVGNRKLMEERGVALGDCAAEAERLAGEGKTPMFAAEGGLLAGIIAVADVVKPSSRAAVETLRRMGIQVAMLTGDNARTAAAIARQAGIDRVLAEVLPQDKAAEVKKLQGEGRTVAMVGDGINDAPALAQADVGIAIGSGTDVAMESADIVLMRSDLLDVATAIDLSKKTIRNIKQNLFWAFGYNTVGIPVAAGVLHLFGGPLLNPIFAAAAMSLSSVSVVSNALRLKRFKPAALPARSAG